MLDIRFIRENPEAVRAALEKRNAEVDLDGVLDLDARRRRLVAEADELRAERKRLSREIGQVIKAGGDAEAVRARVREMGERLDRLEEELREVEAQLRDALLRIPNMPDESVPVGPDASANVVVRSWGEVPSFDFTPKPHWEIGEALGLFDFERGAKVAGSGFPCFRGDGARLARALIQFMLDLHTRRHGYEEIAPPFLCNAAAMTGTGQLPKFAEDMYHIPLDGLYPIPTAEVPVTNLYAGEVLDADALPILHTAYTPCFRREAGAAGRDTRGLLRVHQFDKVELVKFTTPETSAEEHEKLTRDAETVLQALELPYRVVELCTGDLGFSAAKCYDLELWAAAQERWLEVSSCSNFRDFQARRANIRYRAPGGKPVFVHTLNGSGVALPRLLVALLENNQQPDGSVILPAALRPYLDGMERLEPKS